MRAADHLVEQHILESQSHLRHIEELMGKARDLRSRRTVSSEHEAQLNRLELDHSRVRGEFDALRTAPPPDAAERSQGSTGVLKKIGLELEKTLTAVTDPRSP